MWKKDFHFNFIRIENALNSIYFICFPNFLCVSLNCIFFFGFFVVNLPVFQIFSQFSLLILYFNALFCYFFTSFTRTKVIYFRNEFNNSGRFVSFHLTNIQPIKQRAYFHSEGFGRYYFNISKKKSISRISQRCRFAFATYLFVGHSIHLSAMHPNLNSLFTVVKVVAVFFIAFI